VSRPSIIVTGATEFAVTGSAAFIAFFRRAVMVVRCPCSAHPRLCRLQSKRGLS
jgi:hypothetical protein